MTLTPNSMWWILGGVLVLYALTGGADFGGGVWDLLSTRSMKPKMRAHIESAIGPIWEANHVWLIFIIVLAFTAFPRAYAVVSVAFHLPLLLALLGIILRGAAFVFRSYGMWNAAAQRRWGLAFGIGSVVTPIALGATLAGMSSGKIVVRGSQVLSLPTAGWTSFFAVSVGVFALALFALLAAVHLWARAIKSDASELEGAFFRRALIAEGVAGSFAAVVLWRASIDAPPLFEGLWTRAWTVPLQIATASMAAVVVGAVLLRRPLLARVAVMLQVALVVVGWGAAMDGAIVLGAVTLNDAGARPETLAAIGPPLVVGTALLLPLLGWLFFVFERVPRASSR